MLHSPLVLCLVLLLVLCVSSQIDAFQGPATVRRRQDFSVDYRVAYPIAVPFDDARGSSAFSKHLPLRRDNKWARRGQQQHRRLMATNGSDNDDNKDLSVRLKSYFKSFRGESTSGPNGSLERDDDEKDLIDRLKSYLKSFRTDSTTRATTNGEQVESKREKVSSYIKYPFRYLKHYFAGEKQEEIDGLGDVIVSDETFDDDEDKGEGGAVTSVDVSNVDIPPKMVDIAKDITIGIIQQEPARTATKEVEPVGDRWAVSAPNIDLSGNWTIIATDDFKKDYDKYLMLLGQPFIVRAVALSIVGMTTEETIQTDRGRTLFIRGQNARGIWERTLKSSGTDGESGGDFTPSRTPILTIDKEKVEAEAWWEEKGTVHRSWLRGVTKYGGGCFESTRYLEQDGKVFVCDTVFHPVDETREKARVSWRFLRKGETLD